MGHYCQAARIAVAQIDGGTTLPFTESVRLSSDHGTQGQSGDDDELLQYIRLQVRGGKRSLLRLFVLKNPGTFAKTGSGQTGSEQEKLKKTLYRLYVGGGGGGARAHADGAAVLRRAARHTEGAGACA